MSKKLDNIAIWGVLIVVAGIGTLTYLSHLSAQKHIGEWTATSPIRFLSKAQQHLNEHEPYECVENIQKAIKIVKSIEYYGDNNVNKYLEKSINDLNKIVDEIEEDHISTTDVNMALFEALNAVAYAELMISEHDLENNDHHKAIFLLKTTLSALEKSTRYIQAKDELKEEKLISEVKSAIDYLDSPNQTSHYDFTKINEEIEELLKDAYLKQSL
ncbi:hypothetical protein [Reichenbachiella sp. MALMAid0571]|uniref:hypothetical protein n=1 Tax=Reichenbachiella sp. MALMAid0571 TaxID=3143939 RepID=UPI0032DEF98A